MMVIKRLFKALYWQAFTLFPAVAATFCVYKIEEALSKALWHLGTGYRWTGPFDIPLWCLALAETMVGFGIGLLYVPRWFGYQSFSDIHKEIVLSTETAKARAYLASAIAGAVLGIGCSGAWKIVLMLLYIVY